MIFQREARIIPNYPYYQSCKQTQRRDKFVEAILFAQQQAIFDQATAAIREGQRYILLSGASGCGKTFLSNRLCTWITEEFHAGTGAKSIRFLGDNQIGRAHV